MMAKVTTDPMAKNKVQKFKRITCKTRAVKLHGKVVVCRRSLNTMLEENSEFSST